MILKKLLAVLIFFSAISTVGCKGGSPVVETFGNLKVTVTGNGVDTPVSGATVRIGDRAAVTDTNGSCSFTGVLSGNTTISVTRPGYQPSAGNVTVEKDTSVTKILSVARLGGAAAYDVVIVGAGTGGVAAAIQASRMGMRVALLEESDWIGGQMTAAAVTSLDEGTPRTRSGIYQEFLDKVVEHYRLRGKSTGTAYFGPNSTAFEPFVGQRILYQMLQGSSGTGSQLDLYLRTEVSTVMKSGNRVTGVTIKDDDSALTGKIVIDATEYGDLIPLAGARYRSGNSTSDNIDLNACLNPITYTAVIRKFLEPTLLMSISPPGYTDIFSNFQASYTSDGANGSTYYTDGTIDWNKPVNFSFHNAWRGMPDSLNPNDYDASFKHYNEITKTGINNANTDFPVAVEYLENRSYRHEVNCQAKLRTLQFLYYIQNELKQPDWSVAIDEGFNTPYNVEVNTCSNIPLEFKQVVDNFPVIPYVRESRRVIGIMTLKAADIKRDDFRALQNFPSSLAVGNYLTDLHGCSADINLDCGDKRTDISTRGLFQVPFETFVPETVDGLLVAEKNISVSRLVSGAIRLQPITMMTGQAAGALAAVAVQQGLQPRQVKPMDVQWKLLEAGCMLSLHDLPDVPVSHTYWKQIQLALLYGIGGYAGESFDVNGSMRMYDLSFLLNSAFGVFVEVSNPDAMATRADFALLTAQAMGLNLADATAGQVYADVPPSHPAFRQVQFLQKLGAFGDLSDNPGLFLPNQLITRGEISFFVVNAALKTGTSTMHRIGLKTTDTQFPTGSVVINNGQEITNSLSVSLTLNATDNRAVTEMQFKKDNTGWYPWEPYAASRGITLPSGDGVKTVFVRFRDAAGNVSPIYSDTIILHTSPPAGTIIINGNAETTRSKSVTLNLSAIDDSGSVTDMQLSKDGSNWYSWEAFAATRTVTLTGVAGVNTIYVRFRDRAGNVSQVYSDTIVLAP